ncbi:NAD-dependent epimerase/dehydratase family protein [Paenibacillus albiflavus]|uniref:NAD-dependent epimerase/dehydratase family protein n=1 Tax=Paenibacillus albiflavus TaxID=2545760 RepID=A0A4R4EEH7_9BACL|nr:NAD(P)H-binding protein [Paenibacillus albiflavus]TCZ78416.1 NAD-dependent epimerase/dehydratase family protein [Paenibacillus albiflavus]
MQQTRTIAIIGGTGKVGKYIAKRAIDNGYYVRMLVRNPDTVIFPDHRIEVVQGDVLDMITLRTVLKSCDIVMNTFGQPAKAEPLYSQVTEQILSIMNEFGIYRYIGVTGGSLNVSGDQKSMKNKIGERLFALFFSKMMIDKRRELDILEKSQVDWTLVRLPFVKEGTEKGEIKENVLDMPGNSITNNDIASFLIQQIDDQKYLRKTPCISG